MIKKIRRRPLGAFCGFVWKIARLIHHDFPHFSNVSRASFEELSDIDMEGCTKAAVITAPPLWTPRHSDLLKKDVSKSALVWQWADSREASPSILLFET